MTGSSKAGLRIWKGSLLEAAVFGATASLQPVFSNAATFSRCLRRPYNGMWISNALLAVVFRPIEGVPGHTGQMHMLCSARAGANTNT